MNVQQIRRGEIYYANLAPTIGSEQGGIRPVLVIQNNMGNLHSPTIIAAVITGRLKCRYLPTHILPDSACGLPKNSMVMLEQLRTLDKRRFLKYVGHLDMDKMDEMDEIDAALWISIGLAKCKPVT